MESDSSSHRQEDEEIEETVVLPEGQKKRTTRGGKKKGRGGKSDKRKMVLGKDGQWEHAFDQPKKEVPDEEREVSPKLLNE